MCGRFALFEAPTDLADEFGLRDVAYERTYNAAPSEDLPVVLDESRETLTAARWGLVPSWSEGPGSGPDPINARAETLRENRVFRDAYESRRCVVPMNGFYEWAETADGKQPYYVSRADGRPFLVAGLWETWTPEQTQTGLGDFAGGEDVGSADPEPVRSFTVVTTEPNALVTEYHDRMAVVLDRAAGERWLTADDPSALFDPGTGSETNGVELRAWRVSRAVNDPSNDRPGLVEAVA